MVIWTDLKRKLEELHKEFPHKPLLITEYGADVDTRIHSFFAGAV